MFDLLGKVVNVAASVVTVPLSAGLDLVTMGGELVDKRGDTYTEDELKRIAEVLRK